MSSNLSYCAKIVRDHDPDRFLLSMLTPPSVREHLWALFAFNHEIAKTREVVSETQLGLIRLQWWRDEIAKIYNSEKTTEHEILKPLAAAIKTCNLPHAEFETLLHAREFDLEDVLPGNIEGLLNYADFTHTPLLKLALHICGDTPDMEPVQQVAVNYALAGLLRAVPFHARQRRCYLPEDLLQNHTINLRQLYESKPPKNLPEIIKTISDQHVKGIKTNSRFLKAAQALSMVYFNHIKKNKYEVFAPKMALEPGFKAFRAFTAYRFAGTR